MVSDFQLSGINMCLGKDLSEKLFYLLVGILIHYTVCTVLFLTCGFASIWFCVYISHMLGW